MVNSREEKTAHTKTRTTVINELQGALVPMIDKHCIKKKKKKLLKGAGV